MVPQGRDVGTLCRSQTATVSSEVPGDGMFDRENMRLSGETVGLVEELRCFLQAA